MDTNEIKALIDQKIAGQGSMIDIGGALPQILTGIIEAISSFDGIVFDLGEITDRKQLTPEQIQGIDGAAILQCTYQNNKRFITRVSNCDVSIVNEISEQVHLQNIYINRVWGVVILDNGIIDSASCIVIGEDGVHYAAVLEI